MEEFNIFYKLYEIQYEIDKESAKLNKIENDLKIKGYKESNKSLHDQIAKMRIDSIQKMERLNNSIFELQRKYNITMETSENKDKEISILKERVNNLASENKNYILKFEEDRNFINKLNSKLNEKENSKQLETKTREYLRNLYKNE